jgi:ATP-dependent RNA helicase RhlE
MQALAEFKEGKMRILVATDIAARGLDIESLPFVVNFDLPLNPEDYVHRIGRTGRAGLEGEAISLVGEEDHEKLSAVERLIRKKLPLVDPPAMPRRQKRVAPAQSKPDQNKLAPASKARSTDPLFDQPYEALQQAAPKTVVAENSLLASTQQKEKQIAALFLPPATKQDA